MPDIPYEIWKQITQYLPTEEVKRLYPVNRSLLNIAMDERYKRGFVGVLSSPDTHRSLTRLVDSNLAARVRTFTLKPADLCRMLAEFKPIQYERKVSYLYAGLRKAIGGLNNDSHTGTGTGTSTPVPAGQVHKIRVKHALPADMAKKNLEKIMQNMTGLTSLVVEILTSQEHRAFQEIAVPLLRPGWNAFGASLRSLHLGIPLEDMERILPPIRGDALTSLEILSMHIRHAVFTTSDGHILLNIILPFLHSRKHSLRSLTLDVGQQVNVSPLLLSMEHFPRMARFRTKQFFSRDGHSDLKGLHHFLQTHQEHLSDLSIDLVPHSGNLPPASIFFTQDCFCVPLPKLQHLSINLHHFPFTYKGALTSYIHNFTSTLVSLSFDMEQQYWSLENVKTLTEPFKGHLRLTELKLSVADFEPLLLDTLAQNLPNLETLHLFFRYLRPDGYTDRYSQDPLFSWELSHYDFSNWRLKVLNIKPGLHLINSVRRKCKIALVQALPSVHTFCGIGREQYVATKEFI